MKDTWKLTSQKLRDAKLYAKLQKCVFDQPQVEFLRYIISNKEYSSYHGLVNSLNSSWHTMLSWICQLVLNLHQKTFASSDSTNSTNMQGQARLGTW